MLLWGRCYAFISTERENLCIHSRSKIVSFAQGGYPEIPVTEMNLEPRKTARQKAYIFLLKHKTNKKNL